MKVICATCGVTCQRPPCEIRKARRLFCSRACQAIGCRGVPLRRRQTVSERFWSKVRKGDGCWEWTASTNRAGYGHFKSDKIGFAHRFSYALAYRPITADECVLHRCDNRKCVRPDHLFLGTRADNNEDMWAKGRGRTAASKVSLSVCAAVALEYSKKGASQKSVAAVVGVSKSQVGRILRGELRPPS